MILLVEDNEAGKQHLFQAFTQPDGSSSRKYVGWGW
jgi:hypothetical protein